MYNLLLQNTHSFGCNLRTLLNEYRQYSESNSTITLHDTIVDDVEPFNLCAHTWRSHSVAPRILGLLAQKPVLEKVDFFCQSGLRYFGRITETDDTKFCRYSSSWSYLVWATCIKTSIFLCCDVLPTAICHGKWVLFSNKAKWKWIQCIIVFGKSLQYMYMYNDKTGQATIRVNRQAVLKRWWTSLQGESFTVLSTASSILCLSPFTNKKCRNMC